MTAVQVRDLRVELDTGADVVADASFDLAAGELLGVVGESGSGKTTMGLALLGHARRGASIAGGSVRVDGRDLLTLSQAELCAVRGRTVAYVPQDPTSALNPALRIETQLREVLEEHGAPDASMRLEEMLAEVRLPSDREFLRRYPHQLSGGQQQRVGVAMAFACRPRLIVLDEPTTGLDVTTQSHVLATVRDLCRAHGVAAIYITHDLAVVAELSDRIAVMYAGRIVELGATLTLFRASAHPYVRTLVRAIPEMSGRYALEGAAGRAPQPGERPRGCSFAPRCELREPACEAAPPPETAVAAGHFVRCRRAWEVLGRGTESRRPAQPMPDPAPDPVLAVRGLRAWHGTTEVVHDVSFALRARECLAIVGESGSGKTTLARAVAGLHRGFDGELLVNGAPIRRDVRARDGETRRALQYVFQSPYSSLNPRKTIGQIIGRPLRIFFDCDRRETWRRTTQALERVSLPASIAGRYPDQLSGGERQRVAVARALAAEPSVLICDEITSALDVSVQAGVVDLLAGLQRDLGVAMLFITHNLPLIRTIAHEVIVLSEGRIVERGPVARVFATPEAAETRRLLADTPSLETALAGTASEAAG